MAAGTISVDRLIQQIEFRIKNPGVMKQMKQGFTNINKIIDQTEKKIKKSFADINASMLQFGFSALFGGMALKRLGTSILKSLVNTYNKATDSQNIFFQKLQGVNAAFEFLKFSIFDALSQSGLVIALIDGFIGLINFVSEFVNKHPLVAKLFVAFAIGAIILGTLLTVLGQLALAIIGFAAIDIFGSAILAGLAKFALLVLIALAIGKALSSFYKKFPEELESVKKFLNEEFTPAWKNLGDALLDLINSVLPEGEDAWVSFGAVLNSVLKESLVFITQIVIFVSNLVRVITAMIFGLRALVAAVGGDFRFADKLTQKGLAQLAKLETKSLEEIRASFDTPPTIPASFEPPNQSLAIPASFEPPNQSLLAEAPVAPVEQNNTFEITLNLGEEFSELFSTGGLTGEELTGPIKGVFQNEITTALEEQIVRLQGTTRGT